MFDDDVAQFINMAAATANDRWTIATHMKVPAQRSSA